MAYGYKNGMMDFPFVKIYHYQLEKLKGASKIEIVFVGDSSLGNAIDIVEFKRLSGKNVQNLALTGSYGYAGSLNMIKRVVQVQKPEIVVIMHTPIILTLDVAYDGFLLTALSMSEWKKNVPLLVLAKTFVNFDAFLSMVRTLIRKTGIPENTHIANDYIRQGSLLNIRSTENYQVNIADIKIEKKIFLNKITSFCNSNDLQCVYAIGPWFEDHCKQFSGFISETNNIILSTGLALATEEPKCLAPHNLGDAWDHVAPHAKKEVTEFYYRKLRSFL